MQKTRGFGRGAKRKLVGVSSDGTEPLIRRPKSELSIPKLPLNGFPAEYPYNKDGYRYILAEPDPHGPHRQEFEESQDLAGKPIPGWLCRKLCPQKAFLALHDRATQLKISEDRLRMTGEKGYCMGRANCGTGSGQWFFEVRVEEMVEGGAIRVGWSQGLANLQTPLGFDKFSYSYRSRKGTKFHESRGTHYADSGFTSGDVIGCYISCPLEGACLPQTFKDKPLVKFKSYLYFEEKDEIQKTVKQLCPLTNSRIIFYKNGKSLGTAFKDIFAGIYYPSASLYKASTLSFNFGPEFQFPPKETHRPISDLVLDQEIEQTMADILYLVENDGSLRLDVFYGN